MQVGERERKEMLERVEKEVLDIVSGRLVDPNTKRVYTPGMISKALDQLSSASGQHQQEGNGNGNGNGAGAGAGEENGPAQPRKPLWTGVTPNKSAKSQALEAMKALIAWQPIPVMRARMRLRVTCPVSLLKQSVKAPPGASKEKEAPSGGAKNKKGGKGGKGKAARQHDSDVEAEGSDAETAPAAKAPTNVKDKIMSYIESVESQEVVGGDEWEVVGFAEPGAFKGLNDFIGTETRGRGRVEVLDMAVTHED